MYTQAELQCCYNLLLCCYNLPRTQDGCNRVCAASGPGEEPHAAQRAGLKGARVQDQPARRGQHPAQRRHRGHLHRVRPQLHRVYTAITPLIHPTTGPTTTFTLRLHRNYTDNTPHNRAYDHIYTTFTPHSRAYDHIYTAFTPQLHHVYTPQPGL